MAHLYNEETISQAINTKWAGKTVHFAKETDSTNSWIKRLARKKTRKTGMNSFTESSYGIINH